MIIFLWREVAKPTFHYFLPPIYRFVESIGLSIPRKDFTPASEYKKVPHLPDDTLFSLEELPSLVRNIRRARSDSVGPQSEADAYETLAYREKRRRESIAASARPEAPKAHDRFGKYEKEMGTGVVDQNKYAGAIEDNSEGEEEREVFRTIAPFKPRVRYDVEVVTKLVVYSGKLISWLDGDVADETRNCVVGCRVDSNRV